MSTINRYRHGAGRMMRIWPGESYPLGATWDGGGTNFALFSEHATRVVLCLFDDPRVTGDPGPHPAAARVRSSCRLPHFSPVDCNEPGNYHLRRNCLSFSSVAG